MLVGQIDSSHLYDKAELQLHKKYEFLEQQNCRINIGKYVYKWLHD